MNKLQLQTNIDNDIYQLMRLEDIQREFDEIKRLMEEGKSALAVRDFKTAHKSLSKALALLAKGRSETDSEFIECLLATADASFGLRRYNEARIYYLKLLDLGPGDSTDPLDRLSLLIRLGKSSEHSNRTKDCFDAYMEAVRYAKQNLPPGHRMISMALESYAAMLERYEGKSARVIELQRQAKENSSMRSDQKVPGFLEQLKDDYKEPPPSEVVEEPPTPAENRTKALRFAEAEIEERPQRSNLAAVLFASAATVVLLLIVGVGFLIVGSSHKSKGKHVSIKPKVIVPFHASSYSLLEGGATIDFVSPDQAHLRCGKIDKTIPWSDSQTLFAKAQPAANHFTLDKDRLMMPNGRVFYGPSAPELRVVEKMHALADAAQQVFKETGEYPDDLAKINSADLSGSAKGPGPQADIAVVYAGRDKTWVPDSPASDPACRQQLEAGQLISSEAAPKPVCVYGYFVLNGTADTGIKPRAFLIRATDRGGKWLAGAKPDKVFLIALENGVIRPQEAPDKALRDLNGLNGIAVVNLGNN